MPHPSIFISYRIADSLTQAGRLFQSLEKELGENVVFYDKNSLKPGMKWPNELADKVRAAKIVLLLYKNAKEWLGVDDYGTRRIDDPEDWLRKEAETALADSQTLVVPVLLNDAKLPPEHALPPSLQAILACQHKQIRETNWDDDLLPLVKVLREHLAFETSAGSSHNRAGRISGLGFHAYTCDRDSQFDHFDQLRNGIAAGSQHFFYLYGGELQAHKSFFRRIAHELEGGYLENFDNADKSRPVPRVVALDFVVEDCTDPERLRERFVRNLYTAFGLDPGHFHPLLRQNLTNLLLASEKTRDLRAGSFVCVFAHISHWYWNCKLTPEAARWFMENFCPAALPPDSPGVLFFFAFDFNEDQNPGVRDEVLDTIRQKAQHVVALPELDMVLKKDVGKWLVRYQRYFSAPLRQQILTQYFTPAEYYMENLEPVLKKLIDDHFNSKL